MKIEIQNDLNLMNPNSPLANFDMTLKYGYLVDLAYVFSIFSHITF